METKQKKTYKAPGLTAVTFRAERGYASSSLLSQIEFHFWEDSQGSSQMENYSTANDWNQGSNNFWD